MLLDQSSLGILCSHLASCGLEYLILLQYKKVRQFCPVRMSACRHYFSGLFLQAIQQQCTDAHVSDIRPSSTAVETEEERESPQAFMLEPTRHCAAVRHDLLMAKREAAAADAAVAAVAQVSLFLMQSA
jgi:hypothetical protein